MAGKAPAKSKKDNWREYERRKKQIQNMGLSCEEYEVKIKELCRELRV